MRHKCFISFKVENIEYKEYILKELNIEMIDKSLDYEIDSTNEDYIMKIIKEKYLRDSTVTIHLIGKHSAENAIGQDQIFIKRELQASLYDGENNRRNGILGVVLPEVENKIYYGNEKCEKCDTEHSIVAIDENTVVLEFYKNYYIPKYTGCSWNEDERYCVLVKWEDFIKFPEEYIEKAFEKRNSEISKKVTIRP
jgi:hypothetical protein